jgi:phage-related protein
MPPCRVVLYRDDDGSVPVLEWLKRAESRDKGVAAKCFERLARLAAHGRDLRRPLADYLRDGIHELRVRKGTVNYRILYFHHGGDAAVVAHALTKDATVPDPDIERALTRKARFEQEPETHAYSQRGDPP